MNDYDVDIAHARGEHVWHVREDTGEFFPFLVGMALIDGSAGTGNP
jgi:hypothetical protein